MNAFVNESKAGSRGVDIVRTMPALACNQQALTNLAVRGCNQGFVQPDLIRPNIPAFILGNHAIDLVASSHQWA